MVHIIAFVFLEDEQKLQISQQGCDLFRFFCHGLLDRCIYRQAIIAYRIAERGRMLVFWAAGSRLTVVATSCKLAVAEQGTMTRG